MSYKSHKSLGFSTAMPPAPAVSLVGAPPKALTLALASAVVVTPLVTSSSSAKVRPSFLTTNIVTRVLPVKTAPRLAVASDSLHGQPLDSAHFSKGHAVTTRKLVCTREVPSLRASAGCLLWSIVHVDQVIKWSQQQRQQHNRDRDDNSSSGVSLGQFAYEDRGPAKR